MAAMSNRRAWTSGLVGALAAAMAAGCSGEAADVRYRLVGLPRATAAGCGDVLAPPQIVGATRVRLTFRDRTETGPGPLRCDVVLPLVGDRPVVSVPRKREPVAMWVEYFDDAGLLLARGARPAVDLDDGATVTIAIGPTSDLTCAPTQAATARAFHSATALPTGEVLLLGGLAGAPGEPGRSFAPGDGAYAIAAPELYDPLSGRTRAVTIAGLLPRAFHQVAVIGADATTVRLLVFGGHGVDGDHAATGNVAMVQGGPGEPPWRPTAIDLALGRAGARSLPAELLIYDVAASTFTRTELAPSATARLETSGAGDASGVVLVGGRDSTGAASGLVEALSPVDGALLGMVSGRGRIGATVTMVSATEAIVVGGDVTGDPMMVTTAARITALGAMPAIAAGPIGAAAFNRAYHAAARLGDDQIAVVGGLTLGQAGVASSGPASTVARLDRANLGFSAVTTTGEPTLAYPDAVTLHDGGVLAVGGASGLVGSTLALRLDPGAMDLPIAAGSLGVGRHGHRLTRLFDDTILVTGGFVTDPADASRLAATAITERFEPHQATDDPLADLLPGSNWTRMAGEVAVDQAGAPVAPCGLLGATPDAAIDAAVPPIDAPDVDAMM